MSLEINQLTGGYAHVPVLKEVSFTVPNNQVVGLIGLNGAGKSTTIKHIIGLLTPQKGTITLDGVTLQSNPDQYRQKVAYVPETPVLYPELTLKEHLELTMMAYDLNVEETWVKANALLKRFRLDNKLDWFPVHFSKGMRQKVMIVNAFMTNADLFIIDEPFTGLDPLAIYDLLEIIAEKKAQGAAILMSTHILATAQQYADSFVLLNQGRVRTTGTLEELKIEFNMADADLDDIYLQMTKEG
ncbi:ABC transporter ATP-binding protein [Latilactobacillus curvatus]|uniref:ABC transporter ATP-binding protein n=1 Tax=Latilactobacillus curvatus TaxID=28038 RepID=UPI0009762B06|nr:ABC transporter ATP-binding protein [Latilactobacillus curvatus]MCT3525587.1 ABC transporter ATP-binding protein [Latilactobacillus curvatus]MDG2976957.1 ABC transporter ATP-binding protein [Latilactobacillus curvatus]UTB70097.1 multidrug ABC transporter ATP-binding protein [Latilactobacillus curvatus]